ncbi:5265_t:CDS:2 [Gigaspora rosea]|nr:5265_t:CDS:2 [Gigaspora rosea]
MEMFAVEKNQKLAKLKLITKKFGGLVLEKSYLNEETGKVEV